MSALKPVTLSAYPVLGVQVTSTAASEELYVVVLLKFVQEKPVLQGDPGALHPLTLEREVPVALVATELSVPLVAEVYDKIWAWAGFPSTTTSAADTVTPNNLAPERHVKNFFIIVVLK